MQAYSQTFKLDKRQNERISEREEKEKGIKRMASVEWGDHRTWSYSPDSHPAKYLGNTVVLRGLPSVTEKEKRENKNRVLLGIALHWCPPLPDTLGPTSLCDIEGQGAGR